MGDYMVVDEKDGSVRIWWNYGPNDYWENGWKFVDGGQIASGVPHANLKTLRFLDTNGDGRADYVYIDQDGSLKHHIIHDHPEDKICSLRPWVALLPELLVTFRNWYLPT
jgi:hypothetical protein